MSVRTTETLATTCAVSGAGKPRRAVLALVLALAGAYLVVPGSTPVLAANFAVNDTSDRVDTNPGNGKCRASNDKCTLRAAIQEANRLSGADTIEVPAGTYTITRAPQNDNSITTGDLDITGPLTITGAGAGATILDGGQPPAGSPPEVRGLDRVLEVHSTAGNVTISGLTIREGYSPETGGGIHNASPGTLRLENVSVLDSYAAKYGGGVHNAGAGRVELVGSTLSGNGAVEGGTAINNAAAGTVAILSGSVVSDNPGTYPVSAGAIHNQAEADAIGTIRIADSTVSGNAATRDGAGVHNAGDGSIVVERSTITANTTDGKGGGIYTASGTVTVTGTATLTDDDDDDSRIADNTALKGGGIYNLGRLAKSTLRSRVEVTNSTVSGNAALESGGGIFNDFEGELTLTDVTVSDNEAGGDGGGVGSSGKTGLTVTAGTFSENVAAGAGGGVSFQSERSATIAGAVFSQNAAGEDGGGGLYTGGSGMVTVNGATFSANRAVGDGGGVGIHSFGTVTISDSVVRDNTTEGAGGGLENSGQRVTLSHLTVTGNTATLDGGGIHNSSSGEFTILDSTLQGNTGENGGGFTNASDSTLVIRRSLFLGNTARLGSPDSGYGGGIFSASDANSVIENSTLSGNFARTAGGGLFHDADGALRIVNVTIWRNSAPAGGGIGTVESDYVPSVPPQPNPSVILRNTIVAGSLQGGSCDAQPLTSEGGNLDGGTACFYLKGTQDRSNANPGLDAIADNGGPTLTHAHSAASVAADGGVGPCPETDERGITRPQNAGCDSGAFEFVGTPLPPDDITPDTTITEAPDRVGESAVFEFTGSDNATPAEELTFECRILTYDPTEPPDPPDPTAPPDPALAFLGCSSPWQVVGLQEGQSWFEVRAIDRVGNVDPTPASHEFIAGADITPPETTIVEYPPAETTSRSATFSFHGTDDVTPQALFEFECRIDFQDWELIAECLNPMTFSDLTTGEHTVEARAIDEADNIDPTPARYTWTVLPPVDCDEANIVLAAEADTWVDEFRPLENLGIDLNLIVRSQAPGENARALVRFALPTELPECELASATLRLYGNGSTPGRVLHAVPIGAPWSESQVTWNTQPPTTSTPVAASTGNAYREWDVTASVAAMLAGAPYYGFLIRDAVEEGDGEEQSFSSRNTLADLPEVPQLVLRFADSGAPAEPPPPPPPPVPAAVFCGQVLDESTLVTNDLTDCPGEGLVIGAPNIAVDLGGHTIDGLDYMLTGEETGLPAGIRNSGFANVVISNGVIQQFGNGVHLTAGTRYNLLENLTLVGNALAGIELSDADDGRNANLIRGNTFVGNTDGVAILNGSENSVVVGNTFEGNLGVAIHLVSSRGHLVESNQISGLTANPALGSDGGIRLEGSSDNILLGNTVSDTGDAGIYLAFGSHRNQIEGNVLTRIGDAGVFIHDSDGNQVIDNVAHLASDDGISLGSANDTVVRGNDVRFNPGGVSLDGSSGNLIEANDASDSQGSGIALGSGSLNNRILNNTANGTGATGISVEAEALGGGGSLIEGNTANGNLADGIAVAVGSHTITANAAHNNGALGISAGEGAVDGGGNAATGNARPEQCINVVCDQSNPVPPIEPDLTPPDTTITEQPPSLSTSLAATFRFSGSDDRTPATALRYECRLDAPPDPPPPAPDPNDPEPQSPYKGENWVSCISPTFYPGLLAGEHTFQVIAIDQGDNFDPTPATYTWTIEPLPEEEGPDSTPPETAIVESPSDPSTSDSATFRFTGSDNATPGLDLVFECRLDGSNEADFGACASPKTYSDLAEGAHTFAVRAIDRSGNADPTPAIHTWTIGAPPDDDTAPETTIESGPDATTVATSATFTFSASEPGSSFECSLDSAAFAACASPQAYTALAVGDHQFEVRATDAAQNTDATPAVHLWTVTSAPVFGEVACGQVLTQSTVVANDLTDCPGDGLVIGADGITVDLDGHIIDGVGLETGIRNDGFDRVTITNGTVQEFDTGVQLGPGTALNIVSALTVQANQLAGIALSDADDGITGNTLRTNNVVGNALGITLVNGTQRTLLIGNTVGANTGQGIRLENSSGNRVEANRVSGSSGAGVALEGAASNTVIGNTLSGNGGGGIAVGAAGLPPSNGNRVEANAVTENGGAGILVVESSGNQLINNLVHQSNDSGIALQNAHDSVVLGNDVRFNPSGIALLDSTGNRLESNNASESSGTGIALEGLSVNNVLVLNTASINGVEGISVTGPAPAGSGNLLDRNTASNNTGDGIQVSAGGHTITANTANDNGGWGIYAAMGSTDGGGNRALDNVQLEQCFGVTCSGGPVADLAPPDTTIGDRPGDPSTSDAASFTFTGIDGSTPPAQLVFQCRLDSSSEADFAACSSPQAYSGLGAGPHTFAVRAIDLAGNVDPTAASFTWTITPPGIAPETTIDSAPDPTTVSPSATFTFSASEPGSSFQCSLDGAAFAACASPAAYSGLAVGDHTFEVAATDLEGLTDATPAAFSWTIAPPPVADQVACGEVLTQSTLVTNDLTDCPGDGLVIGADGITVDLDGHVIGGSGVGTGILNNRFSRVTITNGTVQEFDTGVQLGPGTALNIVSALAVQANQAAGIALSDADDGTNGNTLRANNVVGNALGILLASSTQGTLVRDNTVGANTGEGIRLENSSGNWVESNHISGSGGAGLALEGAGSNTVIRNTLSGNLGGGIAVGADGLPPSNGNRVEANTVEGSGANGILVVDSSGNELINNIVLQSEGSCIALRNAHDNLVRGNGLRNNLGGIELEGSSRNRLEFNNASATGGTGISLAGVSLSNLLVLNTASSNVGEGISVADPAPAGSGNLLDRNWASNNIGDGILVSAAGHTITANTADRNGGWGIYAEVGSTDGGGNRATGNVEPEQCFGVVCEIGAFPGQPDTTIVDRPANPSNSRWASFTYTATDDATPLASMVFQCRFDSQDAAAWLDCEYPQVYSGLGNGAHTFEIRAIDQQGNADPTPAVYTWTVELPPPGIAPDTTLLSNPGAESPLLDVLFTFSGNEPDVTFECSLDGAAFAPCMALDPTTPPPATGAIQYSFGETEIGPHQFQVRAVDPEGNIDPTPATHDWTILGAPTTTIHSGPVDGTSDTSATFIFSANESEVTFECSLDLAPFTSCASPQAYTGLAVGDHEFRVQATDSDGNTELEPVEWGWTIAPPLDTAAPETVITGMPADSSSEMTFTFTGTDDVTPPARLTFECRLDSANELDFSSCASPYNLLDFYSYDLELLPGQHTFEVRAIDDTDPEPKVDPTPASYTWTSVPDTTPPETTILSGPPDPTLEIDVVFEFSGSDNATPVLRLTFECALDGAAFTACASPHSVQGLTVGDHELQVRAVDLAGNVDPTAASHAWTVVGAPETTIVSGPPATTDSTTATFIFSADQPGSTFECSLDGGPFVACASPHEVTGLGAGPHTFEVRAVDSAGNADPTPASHEWTVEVPPDTTPPETTIDSGPDATTTSTSAVFAFSANEPATFECSLDGAPLTPCDSPREYAVAVGAHTFEVQSTDLAENTDLTPARWTWTVEEGTPPPPPVPGDPQPATVTCGQVLTQSTLVQNDLTDCPGEGLVIGRSNIIVDLNGHTIDGPDYLLNPPATNETLPPGIRNSGFDNVTIVNGAVQQFGNGVLLNPGSTGNVLAQLTLKRNAIAAIHLSDADNGTIRGNRVDENSDGIMLVNGSQSGVVIDNLLNANLNAAISLLNSSGNRVESNRIVGLVAGLPGSDGGIRLDGAADNVLLANTVIDTGDSGIVLIQGSHGNRVEGNSLTRTGDSGIHVEASDGVQVIGNTAHQMSDNGVGLAAANDSVVRDNDVRFNAGGVELENASSNNWIEDNDASDSGGVGISIAANGLNNTVVRNTASRTGAQGIYVDGVAPAGSGNLIEGNRTHGNLGGGILVALGGHTISGNVANDNSGWGIYAAEGNTDGGGNTAGGNAEPAQCFNVVCGASDRTPPETTIDSGPAASTTETSATFTFTASEPNSTFACSLDGAVSKTCTSPAEFTGLAVGDHTMAVSATDPAGNVDQTPASHAWTVVPGAAPGTTITSGPPAATDHTTAAFTFSADQPGSTFQCSLDGAEFGSCSSPHQVTGLAIGSHAFAVRAVDPAGNADPTPASYAWTVVAGLETTIDSGPLETTTETSATFTFSASESGSTFECALDLTPFAACASPVEYTGLAIGPHEFFVRATDPDGNTDPTPDDYEWDIVAPDTTPPQTMLDSGPSATTESADATFSFSADESDSTFECSLDAAAFAACTSPVSYTGLALGDHTFAVRAIDPAGNVDPTPASFNWTIQEPPDTTPPDTTITSQPLDPSSSGSASFSFAGTDETTPPSLLDFECRLDSQNEVDFVGCSSPQSYPDLSPGSHTFEVRAGDEAGNYDLTPASYTWTVEAPLDTTIDSGPDATTGSTAATFEFSSNLSGATFECSLDGAAFAACTSPHELTGLAVGAHEFRVRALNPAGTADPSPATHQWTVVAPPETSIDSGPTNPSASATASFTFSADQAGATFECSLDGAAFAACTSPHEVQGLADGAHQFAVQAKVGVTDPTPAIFEWTVELPPDTTAPDTTITSGPPATTSDVDATVEFTGSDDRTPASDLQFECALDGAAFTACSSPHALQALAPGEHRLEVRAIDQAGNSDPTPAIHTWTVVDVRPPDTTIDSGPPATTESTTATFTFSADEPGVTFECALDGAAFAACASPHEVQGLAVGAHLFQVRARDAAGNADATPDSHQWTVEAPPDTTPPDTTIDSGPAPTTGSASATFTFAASEPSSTFECSLDGAAFTACISPHEISGLEAGAHQFRARAIDPAGNPDPTPASYDWTVLGPPETTIDSAPTSPSESSTATFAFSSDQTDSSFECSLDGGVFAACASPHVVTGLAEGGHEFEVRAKNTFGTLDPTPASHQWTVGLPPDTTILSGPASPTASPEANFEFTGSDDRTPQFELQFECALDGAPFQSCSSTHTASGLAAGQHTFQVRAQDAAGEVDPTPASHQWTILGPPETTLLSGPASPTESTEATFTFSADQADATFECSLDAAPFAACASGVTYTDLAYGEHQFLVQAKNALGSVDPTPPSHAWESGDLTPPVVTILSGPPAPPATTAETTATFTFAVDDPEATLTCSLDGAPFIACTSPKEYAGLAVGDHQFEVDAVKPHLLVDAVPVSYDWTIADVAPPDTMILSGPAATTQGTEATFEFAGTDNATPASDLDFECALDGGAYESCSSPHQRQGLAVGEHTLQVRAVDLALNADPTPASYQWTIVVPPETTIVSGPEATSASAEATFIFSSSEPGSSFECSLDGAPFVACASPRQYTGLADGGHRFEVRALSALGVADETPALHEWTVAVPPETTIVSGPPATTESTSAAFGFSASEPGSTFECSLDGAPFTDCASPQEYTGLAVGAHEFSVRAIDPAGNPDPTPASSTWTVEAPPDTAAPETTIDSGPAASTTSTSASFSFSASEPGATFECSLDGAVFAACTSPQQYAGLAVGGHDFRVRATDAAGNTDASPASHGWTISAPPNCGAPVTASANADAWIDQGSVSTNKGTDSILKVQSKGPSLNFRALVRFQLPTVPAGCVLQSATLRLYAPSATTGRTIQAFRLAASWTEGGVTWANQPLTTGTPAAVASGVGYREWTVTSQVQAMYTGSNHGFLIRDATENGAGIEQQFHSREKGESLPQLVISFAPAGI